MWSNWSAVQTSVWKRGRKDFKSICHPHQEGNAVLPPSSSVPPSVSHPLALQCLESSVPLSTLWSAELGQFQEPTQPILAWQSLPGVTSTLSLPAKQAQVIG